ncbi:MAG TPA: OmpA family protein [Thermoanaerobaculia bacterium]|nr:OmpA family protein [Thermoanaerobaculia bacterium]
MNRRLGTLLSMVVGIVLLAGAARAQDRSDVSDRTAPNVLKGDTYVGAQVGVDFLGDTNYKCRCDARQSDFLLYGGRFGHFFTDHFALEATVNWIDLHPGFYDASLGVMYDFTPSIPGWNTYVGLGGGTEREHVHGKGEGFVYLGVGSEYRFNRVVGARFELRGEHVFAEPFIGGSAHTDVQPNVGVVIHFGAPAPPPPPPPPAPEMPKAAPPPPPPAPAPAPPVEAPPPPVVAPAPAPETSTNEIPFERNSSRLSNIAKAVLDRVAARLKDDLHATIVITGYPDEATPERRRETLAGARAEHAKEYLVTRHGIDAGRISTRTDSATPATAGKASVTVTFSPRS